MKISIGVVFILTLFTFSTNRNSVIYNQDTLPIDTIIPQELKLSPGTIFSIGVVQGEDVCTYHWSYQDEKKPNDTTLYEIASITKVFTGLLSAKAVNESKINIDNPITNYLTTESLPSNFRNITVRDLLTHRSGLPLLLPDLSDKLAKPEWETLAPYYNSLRENYSTEEFFNDLRNLQYSGAEKSYSYSNIGANLIGYCLANKYGQSYEDLLRRKIFKPLGMVHTYIQQNNCLPTRGWRDGKIMANRSSSHINADGGIVSCVEDMTRFIKYNLNSGLPDVKLSQSDISSFDRKGPDMGFFWQIDKNHLKTLHHSGGSFGTTSLIILRPETNSGVFLVTNQAGPEFHGELRKIAERLLNSQ